MLYFHKMAGGTIRNLEFSNVFFSNFSKQENPYLTIESAVTAVELRLVKRVRKGISGGGGER